MAVSLAVKYRPKRFEDTLSQKSIITILKKQLELRKYTNCYGFFGPSGCGKTTIARIFGNEINQGRGNIIEIDGASNNGVDAIRAIIEEANQRSLDSEYKIYVIDECHMITNAGWNAFLKTIEEPPKYTIFMFCTTNPEKIPATINNRIMRFNLTKVNSDLIKSRLEYICENEGFTNYLEACDYISKLSGGGVRDAISLLEKCANYNSDLKIEIVLECLGDFSYQSFFNLTSSLVNKDLESILNIIESYFSSGKDLKLFVDQYLDFSLDLLKYCLFKDISVVKIPTSLELRCQKFSAIDGITTWISNIVKEVLNVKNMIKNDLNNKNTIEVMFIKMCTEISL